MEPTQGYPPLPTCTWWVSDDRPVCGDASVTTRKVVNGKIKVTAPLCPKHKHMHDEIYANRRAEPRAGSRG